MQLPKFKVSAMSQTQISRVSIFKAEVAKFALLKDCLLCVNKYIPLCFIFIKIVSRSFENANFFILNLANNVCHFEKVAEAGFLFVCFGLLYLYNSGLVCVLIDFQNNRKGN